MLGLLQERSCENDAWIREQILAFSKDAQPQVKPPAFGLNFILEAAEKRMSLNRLRPYHYDPDTKEDLLPARIEKFATVPHTDASAPAASTSSAASAENPVMSSSSIATAGLA